MRLFFRQVLIFLIIGYVLNLIGGEILSIKQRILTKRKLFYPELRMDEFYGQKDNIDIVFLGSSRCYQGFDPAVVDLVTGMNSFNLGSSSQTPITSYYLLKEVYRTQKPKVVILEISVDVLNTEQLVNGGYILDAMHNSLNKLDFFLHGFDFKEQVELLLPLYRYRENRGFFYYSLFDDIDEHYDKKRVYLEKGFVVNENNISENISYEFLKTEKLAENVDYLKKINTLANTEGSELVFIYIPYPSGTKIIDQAEFVEYIDDKIDDLGKEFINYLSNDEDYGDEYFADGNHLNLAGATKLSHEIAQEIIR